MSYIDIEDSKKRNSTNQILTKKNNYDKNEYIDDSRIERPNVFFLSKTSTDVKNLNFIYKNKKYNKKCSKSAIVRIYFSKSVISVIFDPLMFDDSIKKHKIKIEISLKEEEPEIIEREVTESFINNYLLSNNDYILSTQYIKNDEIFNYTLTDILIGLEYIKKKYDYLENSVNMCNIQSLFYDRDNWWDIIYENNNTFNDNFNFQNTDNVIEYNGYINDNHYISQDTNVNIISSDKIFNNHYPNDNIFSFVPESIVNEICNNIDNILNKKIDDSDDNKKRKPESDEDIFIMDNVMNEGFKKLKITENIDDNMIENKVDNIYYNTDDLLIQDKISETINYDNYNILEIDKYADSPKEEIITDSSQTIIYDNNNENEEINNKIEKSSINTIDDMIIENTQPNNIMIKDNTMNMENNYKHINIMEVKSNNKNKNISNTINIENNNKEKSNNIMDNITSIDKNENMDNVVTCVLSDIKEHIDNNKNNFNKPADQNSNIIEKNINKNTVDVKNITENIIEKNVVNHDQSILDNNSKNILENNKKKNKLSIKLLRSNGKIINNKDQKTKDPPSLVKNNRVNDSNVDSILSNYLQKKLLVYYQDIKNDLKQIKEDDIITFMNNNTQKYFYFEKKYIINLRRMKVNDVILLIYKISNEYKQKYLANIYTGMSILLKKKFKFIQCEEFMFYLRGIWFIKLLYINENILDSWLEDFTKINETLEPIFEFYPLFNIKLKKTRYNMDVDITSFDFSKIKENMDDIFRKQNTKRNIEILERITCLILMQFSKIRNDIKEKALDKINILIKHMDNSGINERNGKISIPSWVTN